jgi:glutathione S-transferase
MTKGAIVLKLYDLAAADSGRRFSPFCWRTKMALVHKELEVETIPWRFTDKDAIAFSGQGRVPVLLDGDRVVFDSWAIATYLEDIYRDRPSLFGGAEGRAVSRFVNVWADTILLSGILPLVVIDIFTHLHEKDRAYFRETREKRLGATLEKVSANRETDVLAFRKALEPVRALLAAQPYFGGATPAYADYAVFGCFQWARCISAFHLLLKDDPVWAWRERLLSAFDGFARRATGYPV